MKRPVTQIAELLNPAAALLPGFLPAEFRTLMRSGWSEAKQRRFDWVAWCPAVTGFICGICAFAPAGAGGSLKG
jgi:uncharacterized protein (DUF2236 family)